MKEMVGEFYLMKTSDPGRVVCVWWDGWLDDPDALLIEGEVDETSAVANCLLTSATECARAEAEAHGLELREPWRKFLRLKGV